MSKVTKLFKYLDRKRRNTTSNSKPCGEKNCRNTQVKAIKAVKASVNNPVPASENPLSQK